MPEKFTELKALITTYEEQRRAAERKKKEAEIILSYLRAALSDLRELDGEGEGEAVAARARAVEVQSQPSVDEVVEEEEDKVETSSVPSGGREKASISALLGGNGQSWDRPE